jgi:hypothetical protein
LNRFAANNRSFEVSDSTIGADRAKTTRRVRASNRLHDLNRRHDDICLGDAHLFVIAQSDTAESDPV